MEIRTGILGKIIILVVTVLVLTMGINTFAHIIQFEKNYRYALQNKVITVGRHFEQMLEKILGLGFPLENLPGVSEECRRITNRHEEISDCYIINTDMEVLYHNKNSFIGKVLKAPTKEQQKIAVRLISFNKNKFYEISIPIFGESKFFGAIRLTIPARFIHDKTKNMVLNSIFLLIGLLIISTLGAYYFAKGIVLPLRSLTKGAKAISDGDFDYHLQIDSRDEVKELSQSFSRMAFNLKQREESLKKNRDELELRVEERTNELKTANEQLNKEIDQHKQTEEVLRETGDYLDNLIKYANAPIIVWNPQLTITKFNHVFEHLTHYKAGEVIGKSLTILFPEASRNESMKKIALTLSGEHWESVDIPILRKEGDIRVALWNSANIYTEDGATIIATIAHGRDITERIRNKEERVKLQARLQQTQKMEAIATLAGGIAHQFNNALSAITGNIELYKIDFPDDKNTAIYFEPMKKSAYRMADLTSQLLAYARGGKYNPKVISLSNFVEDTLPLIQHTINPDIHIETNLARDILHTEADLTQMQMVLSALIANANEAVEDGGHIRITTGSKEIDDEFSERHPRLMPGDYVYLAVEDDGRGMDEQTRSRIFEPFFTTKFQGRGLGMAAVYGIVTNHDGYIFVESKQDKGTVIHIYLPAVEVKEREIEEPRADLIKGTGTVLVIEDEGVVMEVTRAMFERLGYHVLGAKTGAEAVNLIKTFDGDIALVILDTVLPDMGGKEVYLVLKEVRPDVKVIVCSGYSVDGPAQEILNAGAQDFIQKPYSIKTLSKKMVGVLQENRI